MNAIPAKWFNKMRVSNSPQMKLVIELAFSVKTVSSTSHSCHDNQPKAYSYRFRVLANGCPHGYGQTTPRVFAPELFAQKV